MLLFKMAKEERKNIFILSLVVIAVFGFIDSRQIVLFQLTQDWTNYLIYIAPNFILSWILVLLGIAVTYYILKKDKSEAVGIFTAGYIMLLMGVEDLFFFILSPNIMTARMCWFGFPINLVSKLLGEACVSPLSLILNALLGIYLAWIVLKWFFRLR